MIGNDLLSERVDVEKQYGSFENGKLYELISYLGANYFNEEESEQIENIESDCPELPGDGDGDTENDEIMKLIELLDLTKILSVENGHSKLLRIYEKLETSYQKQREIDIENQELIEELRQENERLRRRCNAHDIILENVLMCTRNREISW